VHQVGFHYMNVSRCTANKTYILGLHTFSTLEMGKFNFVKANETE